MIGTRRSTLEILRDMLASGSEATFTTIRYAANVNYHQSWKYVTVLKAIEKEVEYNEVSEAEGSEMGRFPTDAPSQGS